MTLAKKVAANTIYQVIGRVLTTLIALVIVIYLTRYLGVAGYGQYTTIIAYLGVFTILADFGFYMIASREISQNPEKREEIFNNTLTIRTISAIALMLIANLIAFIMPYPEIVKAGIWIFSIGIFAMLVNQVIIVLFQINLTTLKIALGDVVGRALTLVLVILAINSGADLRVVMWAASGGFVLTLIISFIFAMRYFKIRLAFDFSFWKKMLLEAWPIGIVIVLLSFYFRINTVLLSVLPLDNVVVESFAGLSNSEATGLYGPPYRIMDTIIIFPAIFMGIIMPIFAKALKRDYEKARQILKKSMDILIFAGIAMAFIIIAISPQIIALIGGAEFSQSVTILQILGFYMASFFVIVGINYFIVALGRQRGLVKPYLYTLVLNLVIGVLGVYFFSYIGAAVASLIINLVLVVLGIRILIKERFQFSFQALGKSIVSGLIMTAIMLLIVRLPALSNFDQFSLIAKFFGLLILIIVGGLVFLLFLYLLGAIRKEDLGFIRGRIS